ncbi:MAG: ribonuclease H family protein [Bacteroidales bacterium]|nr:ribonuclease H family protein [Bacteroidales bacterium]
MATKKKYYVVWVGKITGVFEDWATCKAQVDQFEGAKYKSFESKLEADEAFRMGYEQYRKNQLQSNSPAKLSFLSNSDPIPVWESLSVDAAWNTVTKKMEYRGVHTATKQEWFHQGPYDGASNNIGEFLAVVHGLALLKQMNNPMPIYTDSITAIAWVRTKKHKSVILPTPENERIFNLLERAENWLRTNTFTTKIIKWDTPHWGEIPADFGRK